MAARDPNPFKLRGPCVDCPFRKDGAISLAPGRFEAIVETLVANDYSTFFCHKTVHNGRTGGEWDDDGNYEASGQESMCAGAIIYLEKLARPTVGMRIGRVLGLYPPDHLAQHFDTIIDPVN
jgi:hypothetical protein